jgi:hypothetical protein
MAIKKESKFVPGAFIEALELLASICHNSEVLLKDNKVSSTNPRKLDSKQIERCVS